MKKNDSVLNFVIRFIGFCAFAIGCDFLHHAWQLRNDFHSITGFCLSLLIGAPLLVLGWRIMAKRFWAGFGLAALCAMAIYDFVFGPSLRHTRPNEIMGILIYSAIVLFVMTSRKKWIYQF